MTSPSQPRHRGDFEVAIICALQSEVDAVEALFDKSWNDDGEVYGKAAGDTNAYTTGVIGQHNVVLAHMPGIGKKNAASVASSFRSSFGNIKLALLVGICGGLPQGNDGEEILLGDVIISDGLIEYDFGRQYLDKFTRNDTLQDSLGKPNMEIRSLLLKLKGTKSRIRLRDNACHYLIELEQTLGVEKVQYPGIDADKLFDPTYRHKHHDFPDCTICTKCENKDDEVCETALRSSCSELKCNENKLVPRSRLSKAKETTVLPQPMIHYGLIASGDTVMKSAEHRDAIATKDNVIAFEMEGAGVWENLPCVVVKGVCDYADSHKHKGWQNYAAATAAAYMKAFLREWVLADPYPYISNPVLQEAPWRVPFDRNKKFVGRSTQLEVILAKLDPEKSREYCQRVAITGLGGVGKTQVALEAAFRIRNKSPSCSVFWVSAILPTSFDDGFRVIGEALQIPGINKQGADIKSLVKKFLSQESAGKWLLIIDNADDAMLYDGANGTTGSPALLNYLPSSRKGSILLTTRNLRVVAKKGGFDVMRLDKMDLSDSQKLLEISLIEQGLIEEQDVTTKLLDNLTHLPLAIKQAAAYMNENTMSASNYLKIYEESDEELIYLLSEEFEDHGRYEGAKNAIASTWLISFSQISRPDLPTEGHSLAKEYLCFMSCIAERDIPCSLLPPATNRKTLEAVGTLKAYAFITDGKGQDSYNIHRLVQIATRNWLKKEGDLSLWCKKALMQVFGVFPEPQYENKAIWTRYLPHAQHILSFQEYFNDCGTLQSDLLSRVGLGSRILGKYQDSEQELRQALELRVKILGKQHGATSACMNDLGSAMSLQGKYKEAEEMLREALDLKKMWLKKGPLGEEHPSTIKCMNNLAIVLNREHKYEEAEQLLQQALKLQEKQFGKGHDSTLAILHSLAASLTHQRKYKEAEQLQRQELELTEKFHGKEHPLTFASMNSLALIFRGQGKYEDAERMDRQTLKLREKVLGQDHPDVLDSMNNLAENVLSLGRYEEAEQLHRQMMELSMKVLGLEHASTKKSRNNLKRVLHIQGKSEEAMKLVAAMDTEVQAAKGKLTSS